MTLRVWEDPTLDNRDLVFARIDIPGDIDLWAVSLHLSGVSSSRRASAAAALVERIRATVPAGDYLVIGGDLNTRSRGEACIDNQPRREPYDWVLADADLQARATATRYGAESFPAGLVLDTRSYAPLADIAPADPRRGAARSAGSPGPYSRGRPATSRVGPGPRFQEAGSR